MRIITYGTEFDNNMRLKLVQEKCIIYGNIPQTGSLSGADSQSGYAGAERNAAND